MYCYRHRSFNYRIISIMFWAFPYLLWQAFGNLSGFVVGVVLAVMLTSMFNSLLSRNHTNTAPPVVQQAISEQEPHTPSHEEYQPYQQGYRAETEIYRVTQSPYQAEQLEPQYEEMQISYPQELPPMEQY